MTKKILLLSLVVLMAIGYCATPSYADQTAGYYVQPPSEMVGTPRADVENSDESLLDLNLPTHGRRYSDLERRIAELERDLKYQDERIRNLDRMIDDVKRRDRR